MSSSVIKKQKIGPENRVLNPEWTNKYLAMFMTAKFCVLFAKKHCTHGTFVNTLK
jgi:hypothetical protein